MALTDLFRTAIRSVFTNKLRALLTMLGVVIGVASVIAMLALGNGARAAVDSTFKELGANQIQLSQKYEMKDGKYQPAGKKLTYQDGLELPGAAPLVEKVEMNLSKSVKVRAGRNTVEITANGVTADSINTYISAGNVQPVGWKSGKTLTTEAFIGEGRYFSAQEILSSAPVCILGYQTALDLFSGDSPLGQTLWVDRTRCTVIGVISELESTKLEDRYKSKPNDALLLPISSMIQALYKEEPSLYMTAHAVTPDQIDQAKEQIKTFLRQKHAVQQDAEGKYQDDFEMTTRKDILGQQQQAAQTFSMLLAAMATVSLVVGGIGIMNVMLVSVTERTREIGVRLAIGAKERDIISQFLLEAVLISLSGGLLGIIAGIFTIPLAAMLNNGMAVLLPESIPMALGVALLTGVLFGLYPALRAARLDPIEALRYE
jgi:putative ABC transport system permease protein